jgi:hypothetical protein
MNTARFNPRFFFRLIVSAVFLLAAFKIQAQGKLRVAVAGMAHDHVHGILNQYKKGEVNFNWHCRKG